MLGAREVVDRFLNAGICILLARHVAVKVQYEQIIGMEKRVIAKRASGPVYGLLAPMIDASPSSSDGPKSKRLLWLKLLQNEVANSKQVRDCRLNNNLIGRSFSDEADS